MRYLYFSILLVASFSVNAIDTSYSNEVSKISIASKLHNANLPIVYLSRLSIDKNPAVISNASGLSLISPISVVYSGYDSSVSYDVSNFYHMNKPRVQSALTIPTSSPGQYLSIGLDSGVSTQKLNVSSGLFLAYTNTINLNKDTFFNYSFGGWLGGKISESPCYDSFDRAYSCKSLTAWSDYSPIYPAQYRYLSVRAVKLF